MGLLILLDIAIANNGKSKHKNATVPDITISTFEIKEKSKAVHINKKYSDNESSLDRHGREISFIIPNPCQRSLLKNCFRDLG